MHFMPLPVVAVRVVLMFQGVARAKSVLGPWEKYIGNPILTDTGRLAMQRTWNSY
jgi:hypothetical protein